MPRWAIGKIIQSSLQLEFSSLGSGKGRLAETSPRETVWAHYKNRDDSGTSHAHFICDKMISVRLFCIFIISDLYVSGNWKDDHSSASEGTSTRRRACIQRVSGKEMETRRHDFTCMRAPLKGRRCEFGVRWCGFQSKPFCIKNDCQVVKTIEQGDPEVTSSHKHQNYNSLQSNY